MLVITDSGIIVETYMQYRRLGKTNWNVSAISMGCWGIGGQWGPVEESEAIKAINTACEHGVNLFDTADAYGMGSSESIVGKVFGNTKPKMCISLPKLDPGAAALEITSTLEATIA